MRFTFLLLVQLVICHMVSAAEDITAYHRKVYAEINESLASYQLVKRDNVQVEPEQDWNSNAKGWLEKGVVRKIVVEDDGDHGTRTREFYFDQEGLVFVYEIVTTRRVDTGAVTSREEHRFYFKDGAMIRYLDAEKQVAPKDDLYRQFETELLEGARKYKNVLSSSSREKKPEPKEAADSDKKTAEGRFVRIEEGDYAHLILRTKGEERSFFLLRPDASLAPFLSSPAKYKNQKVRVFYESKMENIPEAGGKMMIDSCTSIQVLDQ